MESLDILSEDYAVNIFVSIDLAKQILIVLVNTDHLHPPCSQLRLMWPFCFTGGVRLMWLFIDFVKGIFLLMGFVDGVDTVPSLTFDFGMSHSSITWIARFFFANRKKNVCVIRD
jgi:quinol-cytochrome oxidoreductase complex cytochrome b subunit